jgi:hypothetical protein
MLVEFTAYAGDCLVRGTLAAPDGERLTDFVNRQPEFTITNAELVSYADGHVVALDEVSLAGDELFAIEAREPRGETARRIHTVRHRLELKAGPYTILGQLHAMPGSPPLSSIGWRPAMIPLTNATIAYDDATGLHARDITTLIVNRALVDWVRADANDLPAFVGVPVVAPHPAT